MSALPPVARPEPLQFQQDTLPADMKQRPHWVLWRFEEREGKWTKPPRRPDGSYAKVTEATTWSSFEEALRAFQRGGFDGLGIVVRDGLTALDLDKCRDPRTGALEPWASEIVARYRLAGAYIEASPSATGVRILVAGSAPFTGKAGPQNRLEVYDQTSPRYVTLTGHRLTEGSVCPTPEASRWLKDKFREKASESPQEPFCVELDRSLRD